MTGFYAANIINGVIAVLIFIIYSCADNKPHSIEVRAALKGDMLILRIKDDCKAFDPTQRKELIAESFILFICYDRIRFFLILLI